jgi:hypothetical protein
LLPTEEKHNNASALSAKILKQFIEFYCSKGNGIPGLVRTQSGSRLEHQQKVVVKMNVAVVLD